MLRRRLTLITIIILYLVLISYVLFLKSYEVNESYKINESSKKLATLTDEKGRIIAVDKTIYEVWLDLETIKKRDKLEKLESQLNRFLKKEDYKKTHVLLGKYSDILELKTYIPDSILRYSRIYKTYERIYNTSYDLRKNVGEKGKTEYGIEPFLYEMGLLDSKERIKLSLDLKLQKIAYEELSDMISEQNAEGGTVIIMETKTGKIRAAVSNYPWNMAFMGYIEPGSTMKPIIYSIALEEGLISPYQKFELSYNITPVPDVNFTISEVEGHYFTNIDAKDAIAYSSNVAAVKVMQKIIENFSNDWLYNKLEQMGFGEKTGIEFKKEISGVFKKPKSWYKITPYQIAIGQGIGVTPIQLVSIFNIFANEGKYIKPTFLENKDSQGYQIFSPEIANLMRDWLRYTMLKGTARKAYKPGVLIAGKTGTAQKAIAGKGYSDKYYSLFVGFFPASKPKYTIVSIIDDPKKEYYGGEVAAPVATNIFYRLEEFKYPERVKFFDGYLPNLKGMKLTEALYILKSLGIDEKRIILSGKGNYVLNQKPNVSYEIDKIDYVILYLGDEKDGKNINIR
ncbi:cell division protein FtsI (penicillin-binding protein 3) [Marinitoga hydrogenitolerans DSM 16785]|uniref:Cell division protein FtsI (Penicillin-binding protein 3) n=1 Tax=Marinitoga hydrogenitolerans (strain DSM 16785 / JCM 12826 / AT1271) TaxID=1122195 RepID=A0A1M4S8I2_MARH1|nr:penicillin-binding transpeptidase domain-containing protein [Marinitoga hydrogenitolerans]SHE28514.1 cell division protein FtsI (penicillin-binding protein 3) [Marinitoga hydrogenitolerans DSM 16785]